MATIKITKKHHKHLNNPFPSTPKSLPFIQGSLLFNSQTLPSHQIFSVGKDFQCLWSSTNGGYISISHHSQPTRAIWSTTPGQGFVSAALAETVVEESRGSFVIKDRDLHLVCDHQSIEDIRVIDQFDHSFGIGDGDLNDDLGLYQRTDFEDLQFPVLLVTGWLFSRRKRLGKQKQAPSCAKYRIAFAQKTSNQIGFQVRVGQPNFQVQKRGRRYRRLSLRIGKRKLGGWWWRFSTRPSEEEAGELKVANSPEFNRIFLTYSSQVNERFYGFGEQFSHMNFKGKRVPIFVQEQGIGRGDQPITFAANLVSYRAGGDWSTTYAPSPFYITSNMGSLYLEGYDYSIFYLTRHDRVQIQIHSNSVQGRILHGNSPSELIASFTETIGRPPELPEWIISGAVVGMQGGTDAVRRVWDELRTHEVPLSAFWPSLSIIEVKSCCCDGWS